MRQRWGRVAHPPKTDDAWTGQAKPSAPVIDLQSTGTLGSLALSMKQNCAGTYDSQLIRIRALRMSAGEVNYLQLLRDDVDLLQQLADVRKKKNDLHDARMRAWDQHRPQLKSNGAFEEYWRMANPPEVDEDLRRQERDILARLDKMQTVLEHLRFSGLDEFVDSRIGVPEIEPAPAVVGAPSARGWSSLLRRSA